MLSVTNTPHLTGVNIMGDYLDFEQLYETIHALLPIEGEDPAFEAARFRILGFCYDIRHAMLGHREYVYVDNGLTPDVMRDMQVVGGQKNLYFSFSFLYPELIFVSMALKALVEAKSYAVAQKKSIKVIEYFCESVMDSMNAELSKQKALNAQRSIHAGSRNIGFYMTQYIDLLNLRYLDWDKEKRKQNLSIIAKRIAERDGEYCNVEQEVYLAAKENDCDPSQIRLRAEYPEDIEW